MCWRADTKASSNTLNLLAAARNTLAAERLAWCIYVYLKKVKGGNIQKKGMLLPFVNTA
jgi:hypothetical protein